MPADFSVPGPLSGFLVTDTAAPMCLKMSTPETAPYGFEHYYTSVCDFNSTELKDIEYIQSTYYNKEEIYRFSSSLGKYVGYTEYGMKQAEYRNNLPGELSAMRAEKERYCQHNIGNWYSNILSKSGELILTVNQTDQFIINNQ
uniref:MHC class II beta chain N-terminal domain-containing protein n=1 Tax=Acanthochromis polyacanthus TaxID=80966 RepID=A0A3Q1GB08_9TELE